MHGEAQFKRRIAQATSTFDHADGQPSWAGLHAKPERGR